MSPKKIQRFARKITFLAPAICFFVFVVIAFVFLLLTPSIDEFEKQSHKETSTIYDRSGQHILYEIYGEENRKPVPPEEIPDYVREATIAVEDENFYSHPGIDPSAIIRALFVNLQEGGYQQGASTITQQLARSVLLTREKTLSRKITEALLALKLDATYSKGEILNRYLNQVPYGSNAYGIQAAATTFYNKDAKDLTLGESTLLAALPNAPSYYSPYGNHTDELVKRQKYILSRLLQEGHISQRQATDAVQENALSKVVPLTRNIEAPHFVFMVLEELEKQYGRDVLETSGLKIYTTLDWNLQQRAEQVIGKEAEQNVRYGAKNAALVALDTNKGEVLSLVGSRDYFDKSIDGQVNVAISPRQPGSSFKPLVYAEAFEKGYQPETVLFDIRTSFGPDGQGHDYVPLDYDEQYRGAVTMRQALANSLNIPAVETQYLAGLDDTLDHLDRMGITSLKDRNRFGLSLVLGSGEVSLLEMTNAYAVFSQDGNYTQASTISKVVGQDGKTLYEHAPNFKRVISAESSRKIASILSDNSARSMVFGPNTPLAFKEPGVAAKTGTTQDFHDGWTLGFTKDVALGIWVGNSDNTPLQAGADGVFVAAPLWRSFMNDLLKQYPPSPFADYTKVESDKPLLTGIRNFDFNYNPDPPQNKKEERARAKEQDKMSDAHTILYYVNKDDPLSDKPPNLDDPMLWRWEDALHGNSPALDNQPPATGAR